MSFYKLEGREKQMFMEERHQEILQVIARQGRISIGEIQERYGVSVDSARRDLRILEEKKLLKRTHGGAIPLVSVGFKPSPKLTVRDMAEINPYYDAIARQACAYIREGEALFITSGTVGYLMLRHLPRDIPYTIVTNSLIIADELKAEEQIAVYLIGGRVRSRGNCVDALAVEMIKKLRLDVNFITGAGFSAAFGLSNGTPELAAFQQAIIANSRRNIILAPCNKIGFTGFLQVARAEDFDILITDEEAVEEELAAIRECGVEVIVADMEAAKSE
jgi:DeoR/GlpR family transcriptional regulator of sugar metabolism